MPPWRRVATWFAEFVRGASASHIEAATSLPELLARLGRHYAPVARSRAIGLEFEVDPALAADATGPFAALARALALLLERSLEPGTGHVALQVDVVGDDASTQIVHFTVADERTSELPDSARLDEATAIVTVLGGVVHQERAADIGSRVIVELAFELPRLPPRIDVAALRSTLGGDAALREVIVALDHALSRDLAGLDALLGSPGVTHLQAWLHRVSGALGMAEATELSCIGLELERDLTQGRSNHLDRAIRRFAEDAAEVLAALREHAGPIGYSSRS
jgi:hypothetical protein